VAECVTCLGGLATWILDGATTEGEMTYADSPAIKAIDGTTEGDSQS
jgi:hypothetical protein